MTALKVVAGILRNCHDEVLISQRSNGKALAGYWEFPGGKLESRETPLRALARELDEELRVKIHQTVPLIRFTHFKQKIPIELDVYEVVAWSGEPMGNEGQALRWVALESSEIRDGLLPANRPIANALRLPRLALVTPELASSSDEDRGQFLARVELLASCGVRLIQLRVKQLSSDERHALALDLKEICRKYDVRLTVGLSGEQISGSEKWGVHYPARMLSKRSIEDLHQCDLTSTSCHDQEEVARATALEVDFAYVSPVARTTTHPGAEPLGWKKAGELAGQAALPVFALGGLSPGDLAKAVSYGFHGVAVKAALWDASDPRALLREALKSLADVAETVA